MKFVISTLAVVATVALAQERCDAPYPTTYCNTTEITAFESFDCSPFHVFIARGSDEPYPGRQGNVTSQICARIGSKDCTYENIEYPAKSTAWGQNEWCESATKGQAAGQAQMKGYAEKCPNSKLILLGYSQGAAVAEDILAGGGGKVFECEQPDSPPLDSATGSKVVAVVTFGSVIRSKDQNYTIGEGKSFDGKRAHTTEQLEALNKYSDRLREYCHQGDPICAVGSEPVNVYNHLDYFLQHNAEVVSWVADKVKPGNEQSSSTTSAVANSAAASPSVVTSSTQSATDTSEAQPAQSGNKDTTTGAASVFAVSPMLAAAAVAVFFAI